ncbi:4'-phosphopantetheinyl transferase family protein [Tellurirhabdus rosea]|uniref:4'-phosphopantetheinyl transferase family protein n=1 Tax=Tellurirhabdus rosea TaxID=2674997 RepID=UPI002253A48B|nr:4'-phosphopantetheinyl transferase superfamily protein [Tellurirhabdus rosea]
MPLHQMLRLNADCSVALWKIEEEEADLRPLLRLTGEEEQDLSGITHPGQRAEWLACRVAMQYLTSEEGLAYAGLEKDEHGKPHLKSQSARISLSHTHGWAAAALHRTRPVGIDAEPLRKQLKRVVPRVLSDSEIEHAAGDLDRLAVYWCAKEALYKLYGKRQLTFREHLHVEPFADGAERLVGHVRLPEYVVELTIYCLKIGPGLVAVAL